VSLTAATPALEALGVFAAFWWSMIFPENRHPLFGIML